MIITSGLNKVKGNIAMALVVALIAVMSGVSLATLAFQDATTFRYQLDGVQEFHLLRSEVGRGRLLASHFEDVPTPPLHTVFPERTVSVDFGSHRTIYNARTKLDVLAGEEDTGYYIRSLITATRGDGTVFRPEDNSPVKRYGENRILSLQTIALFHYFTDVDRTLDDRPGGIVFYGGDIIHGRVHSNSEITINYSMAGAWPQFYGLVSTGETIRLSGGSGYNQDEVFMGPPPGLIENHPKIEFEPTADLVRQLGTTPFGTEERDDRIAYITVEGSTYEGFIGEVRVEKPVQEWIEGYNQFTIYDSYPPYGPVGQEIGVNRIPKRDTIWTPVEGSLSGTSAFVPMELWISGNFGGRQTWASSHDIYLKDDLTYVNTPRGQRPDGIDDQGEQTLPVNSTDFLGIISEECIYIQYGHWSPADSMRHRPNTDNIHMYGAYCAVGQSEFPWYDGVITFQYERPKGSTPPQYWHGEYFTNSDLHLFHYPTTTMNPWPRGLDYPWYNPLWPEPGVIRNVPGLPGWTPNPHDADEVVEWRGNIYVFGSLAQRRRGIVAWPGGGFSAGIWDIDNTINPNNPPTYGHAAPNWVGYDKRYTEDRRFERTGPPHYPIIRFKGYETEDLRDLGYQTKRWVFKTPPTGF